MSLVTIADYRELVPDDATDDATIQRALDRAERLVSKYLLRPLAQGTYTENLRVDRWSGVVHPTATPVVSVSSPANVVVLDGVAAFTDGNGWDMLVEHSWDSWFLTYGRAAVTYVGGWTNGVDPDTDIPQTVLEMICVLANRFGSTALVSSQIPLGATEVKLGDASVRFAKPYGMGASLDAYVPGLTGSLKPYRYRY
jgi:hypothetical protein